MKYLVTGGAGFIGSTLTSALLNRGHSVRVFDNFSTGFRDNLNPQQSDLQICEGDIRDPSSLPQALDSIDGVFHLAASVGNKKSIEDPRFDANSNVLGMVNLLEAMRTAGIRDLVYSSSAGIFGEPQYQPVDEQHPCHPMSPYGATKLCAENLALAYSYLHDFRVVSLRYFNVYGVNQHYDAYGNVIPIFVEKAINGSSLTVYGDGGQTRDFVHVDDVTHSNILAMENRQVSGPINIGTGSPIEINSLAEMVSRLSRQKLEISHVGERDGDVRHCTASVEKMRALLGFSATPISMEKLSNYYDWYAREHNSQ